MSEIVLKGIPAATGIAYGQSFILDKGEFIVPKRSISSTEVDSEIARFEEADAGRRRPAADGRRAPQERSADREN